ncbi:hypothetical protein PIIN_04024 [Serendipita indica DSM 11827]|uniref:Uncharacterized protein n=1 Tax=Serendipita indica (strain DSM 11827) TaxID=1109443 RepID=G4TFL2_SERID|nr:hypothetical protein PIIN_04024 [Serendipita indica DSM 11827]
MQFTAIRLPNTVPKVATLKIQHTTSSYCNNQRLSQLLKMIPNVNEIIKRPHDQYCTGGLHRRSSVWVGASHFTSASRIVGTKGNQSTHAEICDYHDGGIAHCSAPALTRQLSEFGGKKLMSFELPVPTYHVRGMNGCFLPRGTTHTTTLFEGTLRSKAMVYLFTPAGGRSSISQPSFLLDREARHEVNRNDTDREDSQSISLRTAFA